MGNADFRFINFAAFPYHIYHIYTSHVKISYDVLALVGQ